MVDGIKRGHVTEKAKTPLWGKHRKEVATFQQIIQVTMQSYALYILRSHNVLVPSCSIAPALPSPSDLPKSWLHQGPYSSSKRKSRWALNLPPWRRKASPTARGMKGPSCNHSFIHGSYSRYMPCPIPVLDMQEWTRWHSPSSSHTAQTGHSKWTSLVNAMHQDKGM